MEAEILSKTFDLHDGQEEEKKFGQSEVWIEIGAVDPVTGWKKVKKLNLSPYVFQQFIQKGRDTILREKFFIKAIINLIKKSNFLNLTLQLEQEQITDKEFEIEIEKAPDKYIINLDKLDDPIEIKVIIDIIKFLGLTFSLDEVSELFGVTSNNLEQSLQKLEE